MWQVRQRCVETAVICCRTLEQSFTELRMEHRMLSVVPLVQNLECDSLWSCMEHGMFMQVERIPCMGSSPCLDECTAIRDSFLNGTVWMGRHILLVPAGPTDVRNTYQLMVTGKGNVCDGGLVEQFT